MSQPDRPSRLPVALILSAALVLAAGVLGFSFVRGQRTPGAIQVVGAATVPFTSDVVKWRVALERHTAMGGEVEGYRQLAQDRDRFLAALSDAGVPAEDVSVQPMTTGATWDRDGVQTGVNLRQSFLVISDDVDGVEALALEYFYEDMATLKHSMLRQAREDAQGRAEEIAGDGLGGLLEARAGVFQIREPYSTEVQGYGMYSTATRSKEMTVTVHASFQLR